MKFNWGTGIVASFIIFFLAIAYIIVFPFNQKVELVTDNYYEKELKYQEQIDRIERTSGLSQDLEFKHDSEMLIVKFPGNASGINGDIFFYRPSDSQKDFTEKIVTDSLNTQVIDIRTLDRGMWKVKIQWEMNSSSYYMEKVLII